MESGVEDLIETKFTLLLISLELMDQMKGGSFLAEVLFYMAFTVAYFTMEKLTQAQVEVQIRECDLTNPLSYYQHDPRN